MTISTFGLERESIHETLHQWQAEQESLDAQWNESLEALAAYQSHLDAWQQQLGRERENLRQAREEWERERSAADLSREQSSTQVMAQLAEAREKVANLSEQLLSRTEELRQLDQTRVDLTAELEKSQAMAQQLTTELDEHKRTLQQERAAAAERLLKVQELQESIDRQVDRAADQAVEEIAADDGPKAAAPMPAKLQRKLTGSGGGSKRSANSPVLGSIVEQFGKLRQQRASERQAGKKQG